MILVKFDLNRHKLQCFVHVSSFLWSCLGLKAHFRMMLSGFGMVVSATTVAPIVGVVLCMSVGKGSSIELYKMALCVPE